MIVGIGNDLVDIQRLKRLLDRYPQRLPQKILTEQERHQPKTATVTTLAGRWAAKEALGKALGCGIKPPLTWQQITVINDDNGRPSFIFSKTAKEYLQKRHICYCHLSIAHDGNYAIATVVATGNNDSPQ